MKSLAHFLDSILERYDSADFIATDPVAVPHSYVDTVDREVTAYVAAMLAFGSVKVMLPSIRRALEPLGEHPAEALKHFSVEDCEQAADGFNYRWIFARDLANAFRMLGGVLRRHGSLERAFMGEAAGSGVCPVQGAARLIDAMRSEVEPQELKRRGTRAFVPDVTGGSASKRMHLFLRWMVRQDAIDFGLWKGVSPRDLWMPVDTHVARLAGSLGLTSRKTIGRAMVREITEKLREIDSQDPIKYDFALSRLGILGVVPSKREGEICVSYMLESASEQ